LSDDQLAVGALEPAVDADVIDSLRQLESPGRPSFLAEMVQIFIEDSEQRIGAMATAIAATDAHGVAELAHAMKGSCGNFGAHRLESLCRSLEVVGCAGELSSADELTASIRREYERVCAALAGYLDAP